MIYPATEPCEAAAVAERVGEAVPSYKTLHCPRRALPSSHRTPAFAAGPLFSYVFGRVLLQPGSVPTGRQGGPKRAPKGPTLEKDVKNGNPLAFYAETGIQRKNMISSNPSAFYVHLGAAAWTKHTILRNPGGTSRGAPRR